MRGPIVMKGYWEPPRRDRARRSRDGWFHTGDMAPVDEDGYFFIVDRKKDLIIRGGYNVYPREIEEVLYEHPAVREAAVVGVPARLAGRGGRRRRRAEGRARSATPGRAARRSSRSASRPTSTRAQVWFVDELPKGPTGKILKREIEIPAEVAAALRRRAAASPCATARRSTLRPIEAADRDGAAEGFERLSPESRYRRFFAPMPRLSERDLDYLTRVDHHDHEALVALDARTGDGVGVARFVRTGAGAWPSRPSWSPTTGRGAAWVARCSTRSPTGRATEGVAALRAPVLAENDAAHRGCSSGWADDGRARTGTRSSSRSSSRPSPPGGARSCACCASPPRAAWRRR